MTRGDVYRIRLGGTRGREQHGPRYGVVVQADRYLALSTVLVAPTSRSAPVRTFRPEVSVLGEPTSVMVEQMRALDLGRLTERVGRLDASELRAVDDVLELVLDLRV